MREISIFTLKRSIDEEGKNQEKVGNFSSREEAEIYKKDNWDSIIEQKIKLYDSEEEIIEIFTSETKNKIKKLTTKTQIELIKEIL